MPMLALLFGCEDPLANTAISQEEKIDSFIKSKYAESTVVPNEGVNRIVLEAGDFDYIGYTFSSSIGNAFSRGSFQGRLGDGQMIKGLKYGITGMCPGEKSYIVFSCKYGYDKPVAGIGKDQALVFEVYMNEIIRE